MMSPETYRQSVARLGLGVLGAGRFFGVSRRAARRWAQEGPPQSAAMVLVVMEALSLSHERVARWMWARGIPIDANFVLRGEVDAETESDVASDGAG